MNDYVNSLKKILANLLNLDEKFKNEDKVLLLLNFLLDEYEHLSTLCFMRGTMSHSMMYAVRCITLKPERKTKRITEIQLQSTNSEKSFTES